MTRDSRRLGIGFVGSGFNARFHLLAFARCVTPTCSASGAPIAANASRAAARARELDVGDAARPIASIADMVADPAIDAIWLCGPQSRAHRERRGDRRHDRARQGRAARDRLRKAAGAQCRRGEAGRGAGAARRGSRTAISRTRSSRRRWSAGRELLWARGAAPTGRPVPRARGGGAQRPAHALVLARRAAGRRRAQRHDVPFGAASCATCSPSRASRVSHREAGARHRAHRQPQVDPAGVRAGSSSRRWGGEIDYAKRAVGRLRQRDDRVRDRRRAYRASARRRRRGASSAPGFGCRRSCSARSTRCRWNTLDSGLKLFFSREVQGTAGEDLVEKQNAETGADAGGGQEAAAYGYESGGPPFRAGVSREGEAAADFDDGLEVVRLLMAAYQSAEQRRTLEFPPPGLERFVPDVAKGTWRP